MTRFRPPLALPQACLGALTRSDGASVLTRHTRIVRLRRRRALAALGSWLLSWVRP